MLPKQGIARQLAPFIPPTHEKIPIRLIVGGISCEWLGACTDDAVARERFGFVEGCGRVHFASFKENTEQHREKGVKKI